MAGNYKFCPTCAFRLRAEEGSDEESPPSRDRWLHTLVFLTLGLLLVGILLLGVQLFAERPEAPPGDEGDDPWAAELPLTVANLPRLMQNLPPADVMRWDDQGRMLRVSGFLKILRIEVTIGMYEEYLRDVEADPSRIPEVLTRLWAPPDEEAAQVLRARRAGLEPRVHPLQTRLDTLGSEIHALEDRRGALEEDDPEIRAIDDQLVPLREEVAEIRTTLAPLAKELDAVARAQAQEQLRLFHRSTYVQSWQRLAYEHLRRLSTMAPDRIEGALPEEPGFVLMIPPSWIELTEWEEVRWASPPSSKNLPVTEVTFFDAEAFAAWASEQHGEELELRLPTMFEWFRAGNGGDPRYLYPWGTDARPYACNNLTRWGEADTPTLLPVHQPYPDAEERGRTKEGEGVWAMSGNAREWTYNDVLPELVDGKYLVAKSPSQELEVMTGTAPAAGGSYLFGIEDCTVTERSVRWLSKGDRREDVGFRLRAKGAWMD